MSDFKNPFAAMIAQSQEFAKAMNPALEHFTPKGFEKLWPTVPAEVMEAMMGLIGVNLMMKMMCLMIYDNLNQRMIFPMIHF